MKYAEINKRFTEIVTKYICDGYTIHTATMSTSQGEISKVDLTNGSEVIRVILDTFYDKDFLDGVEIFVGHVTDKNVLKDLNECVQNTIWNNRLETISCERFYDLDVRGNKVWFGTREEAIESRRKVNKRYKNKAELGYIKITSKSAFEKVLSFVKRQDRCHTKKVSDIDSIIHTEDGRYVVYVGYEAFVLH